MVELADNRRFREYAMAERLKDMFFTKASVIALADAVKKCCARFDQKAFIQFSHSH